MKRMSLRLWFTAAQRRKLEVLIYMLLLAIGCILGTFFVMKYEDSSICKFCITYGMAGDSADGSDVFLYSIMRNGGLWILTLFLGFCAVGQPFLLAVLTIHSFVSGCCLAKMSKELIVSALPLYILTAVYTIMVSFILLLAVREAMRFSCASLGVYVSETDTLDMGKRLKFYLIRFSVLLFMILTASGIYALFCDVLQ